jgi:hypothetical protein
LLLPLSIYPKKRFGCSEKKERKEKKKKKRERIKERG